MLGFVVFGFTVQLALLAFFVARLRGWPAEAALGRVVYGLGAGAVVLGVLLLIEGEPWHLAAACALYAAWAGLGLAVDVVRPLAWREPSRWQVVVPYAALLTAALLAFWVPLWWVDPRLWVAFGVVYAAHTVLNLLAHRAARADRLDRPGTGHTRPA